VTVRFTKSPPAARADRLVCTRPDGTTVSADLPRQGILPHLAFHFVVESTLAWHDALFGRVAVGGALEPDATGLHGAAGQAGKNVQARQCEALVECLEANQWGGTPDPAEFAQRLVRACRTRAVVPPDITAEEVEAVRLALRDFGAAWRPLNPGQALERTFAS
jgi:hypothetical protein